MDRWVNYNIYAFYRVATNNWSAEKQAASQWPDDFAAAYSPLSNVGVAIGGGGPALLWDPTRDVFWCFGASGNNSKPYEINPATFAVTTHNLTGDAPLTPESGSTGTYGRWVFMDSWPAIGSVASRSSPAFVIRLP